MPRGLLGIGSMLLLAACAAGYETVSSTDSQITYRYDPAKVRPGQLASAATNHCSYFAGSASGGLRARAVSIDPDGEMRLIRFTCARNPTGSADELLSRIP